MLRYANWSGSFPRTSTGSSARTGFDPCSPPVASVEENAPRCTTTMAVEEEKACDAASRTEQNAPYDGLKVDGTRRKRFRY